MALGRFGQFVTQVAITILAMAAAATVLLPTSFRETSGPAQLLEQVIATGGSVAALGACVLALAVIWLQPRHSAAPSMALSLVFGALHYGVLSAKPRPPFGHYLGIPESLWNGTVIGSFILVCAGVARLSVLFPRPLGPAELASLITAWRPRERLPGKRTPWWKRWLRRIDNVFIRVVASVPMPVASRRRMVREMIRFRRMSSGEGRPVPLGSVLGLPWTGWSVGLPFAVAGGAAGTLLPKVLATLVGGAFAIVLVTHAGAYFTLGFRLADTVERRKTLWAFAGLLILVGTLIVAVLLGLILSDIAGLIDAATARLLIATDGTLGSLALLACLGIAIFRDGLLDPALVIRKTALYGIVAAALAVLFVVLEVAAARVLVAQLPVAAGFGPAIAGAGVAATVRPLHRALERSTRAWLDRIVPASALAEGQRLQRVVVFSDLSGYTRLTATDEHSALTLASLFHKKARKLAEAHGGRVVKTIGDAVLLDFADVPRALAACVALPAELAAAAAVLELPAPVLRTGVHCGEVVRAPDGDLYGGTVNLAARLQTTAAPGELVASRAVVDSAGAAARFESLGERTLKNVPAPVECWRLARS